MPCRSYRKLFYANEYSLDCSHVRFYESRSQREEHPIQFTAGCAAGDVAQLFNWRYTWFQVMIGDHSRSTNAAHDHFSQCDFIAATPQQQSDMF
jgi:hypothetical protein